MPADRETVLDFLMGGATIEATARRFRMSQPDVRKALQDEVNRCSDGDEVRAEWALTARRLKRMELAFDKQAVENLDCYAAAIALKASERRASLVGANAPFKTHALIEAKTIEEQPNSTEQLLAVLKRLRASDPKRKINGGPGYGDERDDEDEEIARERLKAEHPGQNQKSAEKLN